MNGTDKIYISGLISKVHQLENELSIGRKKQYNHKGLGGIEGLLKGKRLDKIAGFFERTFPWLILVLIAYLILRKRK